VSGWEGVDLQRLAANDTHLLLGGAGEVVRIRRADGGIDLRLDVPPADSAAPEPFVFDPALTGDGTIVVPTFFRRERGEYFEGGLRVYAADGTLRWAVRTQNRQYETPSGEPYTAGGGVHGVEVAEADGGRRVVYTIGQSVVARDLQTGETAWHVFTREHGFGVGPTVADSTVLAGSTTGRLFALDLATGRKRWHVDVDGGMLAPATVHEGVVYQIDDGYGRLWAVDLATGRPLWHAYPPEHRADPDATYRTAPAAEGDRLVVVGSKRVYGLKVKG
jgi:outer membrane protein assembly factor BamB